MENNIALLNGLRGGEAGFGVLKLLLFLLFIGLVVAAVMKVVAIWLAILIFIAVAVLLGVVANVSDIRRYLRISSM